MGEWLTNPYMLEVRDEWREVDYVFVCDGYVLRTVSSAAGIVYPIETTKLYPTQGDARYAWQCAPALAAAGVV